MRKHLIALLLVSVSLAACGSVIGTSNSLSHNYLNQFDALYNDRQASYDAAFRALGPTTPSAASPAQLHTLFVALANADYSFVKGIGQLTSPGTIDTVCQPGAFDWKIRFPVNDCPDVAVLWRAGYALASDEQALADVEARSRAGTSKEPADFAKLRNELDRWRTAANKVRQDIGLPPQSFDLQGLCIAATTC